jgi:nucleotide-binding universal stress UspA family protein
MLPQNILVPVDFSPHSDLALRYALELSAKLSASVVALHAYQIPLQSYHSFAFAEIAASVETSAQKALDELMVKHTAPGVKLRGVLICDDPWCGIVGTARESRIDLIVMGTHGRTGLPRFLMGSVAEKVVRTAECPVLTLHAPEAAKEKPKVA